MSKSFKIIFLLLVLVFSATLVFGAETPFLVRGILSRKAFSEKELVESFCAKSGWEQRVFLAKLNGLEKAYDKTIQEATGLDFPDLSVKKTLLEEKTKELCVQEKFAGALTVFEATKLEKESLKKELQTFRQSVVSSLKTKKQALESSGDKTNQASFELALERLGFIDETAKALALAELKSYEQEKTDALKKITGLLSLVAKESFEFARGSIQSKQISAGKAATYLKDLEAIERLFSLELGAGVKNSDETKIASAINIFQTRLRLLKDGFELELAGQKTASETCSAIDASLAQAKFGIESQFSRLEGLAAKISKKSELCRFSDSPDCQQFNVFSNELSQASLKSKEAVALAQDLEERCSSVSGKNRGEGELKSSVLNFARAVESWNQSISRLKSVWQEIGARGLAKNLTESASAKDACAVLKEADFDRELIEKAVKNLSNSKTRCAKPCSQDKQFCAVAKQACDFSAKNTLKVEELKKQGETVLEKFSEFESLCASPDSNSAESVFKALEPLKLGADNFLFAYEQLLAAAAKNQ